VLMKSLVRRGRIGVTLYEIQPLLEARLLMRLGRIPICSSPETVVLLMTDGCWLWILVDVSLLYSSLYRESP
jgi:hypothetical protein